MGKVGDLGNFVQGIMYKVPSTKQGKIDARAEKREPRNEKNWAQSIKYQVPRFEKSHKLQDLKIDKIQDIKIDTRFKRQDSRRKI